ncbi:sialin isoform X2 [Neodiprion lecontei]|uniref:Sialin isoform X2 n=1 Tax=Neodiprion lecontei TaxID=441921 RepID=A0ABM3FLJ8_NEOLC|nr:sialin isoform X2 [Neodiprion lecontei]
MTGNPKKLCHDRFSCRQMLNIMVILGFMLNYTLRVNLTIAIVDMVLPSNSTRHSTETIADSGCAGSVDFHKNFTSNTSLNELGDLPKKHAIEQTRYPWNEYEVNKILGSFFWGYICTELPGGRLAEIVGAKRVFGYSMLTASAVTLLTPLAATLGYPAVAALRVILGFMLGATWPAIHPMTARWIPPMERSKFIANMMASSLGAAITMPICGFLIASIGWESVFYVTGGISLIWSIVWFFVVYDSPAQHPRISAEERRFIEESIGTTSTSKHLAVPWKAMLTSVPVWAIIVTHGCSVFGYFTVVNQLPTYMKYILGFEIKKNGLLSSLPYLGKYCFAVLTSSAADYLRRTNKLSVTAIRKSFTAFAVMTPGLLMIVQALMGCDRITSVAIFTVALTINGGVTAGYLGNGLDIAPNFSGTIFGLANTLSSLGGFLSAEMVGSLTFENQSFPQWRIVFWILAATYVCGGLTFTFFGSGKLQSWNSPRSDGSITEKERALENGKSPEEVIPLKDKTEV